MAQTRTQWRVADARARRTRQTQAEADGDEDEAVLLPRCPFEWQPRARTIHRAFSVLGPQVHEQFEHSLPRLIDAGT